MNNASTPDGRGHDRPNDAEPFFPSEGTFNTVVPLSELDGTHVVSPLTRVDPANVGKPAEAAWARAADRAARREEEETTLVPTRAGHARRTRQSWVTTAAVIVLSVGAGLASGTYLIWSAQSPASTQTPAEVAVETPSIVSANDATTEPVVEQVEAVSKPEKANEAVKNEKPTRDEKPTKDEKPVEAAHAAKQAPPLQSTPRAERIARAADEARAVTPAPKPARSQSAASSRPRPTAVVQQTPRAAPPERVLPISSPPPTAKSKKVIQWP